MRRRRRLVLLSVRLGRFWSAPTALRENHEIIDRGPYGIVRHPIYTATLAFYLGTTLAFSAWWTWALLTLLLLGYVLKALDEERFLGAHLAPRELTLPVSASITNFPLLRHNGSRRAFFLDGRLQRD
jgi:hypothetical protein